MRIFDTSYLVICGFLTFFLRILIETLWSHCSSLLWQQLEEQVLALLLLLQVVGRALLHQRLQVVGVLLHAGEQVVEQRGALIVSAYNKNRLCSKTCGIDNMVKNSKEKTTLIQSELFIMTGNSSGRDPTPKRNHRAEVSGREDTG